MSRDHHESLRMAALATALIALVALVVVINWPNSIDEHRTAAPQTRASAAQPHVTAAQRERADPNVSRNDGCADTPDRLPQDRRGNVVSALMPRWVAVIDLKGATPIPGCIPPELLIPDIDKGEALAAYKVRAGFPPDGVLRPPFPVFDTVGQLAGFEASDGGQTGFIPIADAAASNRVPVALLNEPPSPGDFSALYR